MHQDSGRRPPTADYRATRADLDPIPPPRRDTPLPLTGCPCGHLYEADCIIHRGAPLGRYRRRLGRLALDRPDDWPTNVYEDCRCQKACYTPAGLFICVCEDGRTAS